MYVNTELTEENVHTYSSLWQSLLEQLKYLYMTIWWLFQDKLNMVPYFSFAWGIQQFRDDGRRISLQASDNSLSYKIDYFESCLIQAMQRAQYLTNSW